MSLTFNSKTFTADSFGTNAVGYVGPAHTQSVKDDLRIARVLPKPTAVFSGVGRTSAKLTRTLTLTGAETPTGDLIIEVSVSAPVGAAGADLDAAVNDVAALVALAAYKLVVKNQQISH